MESKICSKCKIDKPIINFSKEKDKLKSRCKECVNKYNKEYKEKDKEKLRNKWRQASRKYHTYEKRRNRTLRKYGLTEDLYNKLFDLQNGQCAICLAGITLVVDHCHKTNKVRGLLCNDCNTSLGKFKDDVEILNNAINYLLRHREVVSQDSHKV